MTISGVERRVIPGAELRAAGNGSDRFLTGYAARYNKLSTNLGDAKHPWFERIAPHAFEKVLRSNPDVRFLINHDPGRCLGRTRAGTLKLHSDSHGLGFQLNLPDSEEGRSVHLAVQRGDTSDMSFAFSGPEDHWDEEDELEEELEAGDRGKRGKRVVRTLSGFGAVLDVSSVTYPAYEGTAISARAAAANIVLATPPAVIQARTDEAEVRRKIFEGSQPDRMAEIRQRRANRLNLILG